MSATLAIMRLETRRLFVSPLSWVLAAMTQLLAGLLFVMTLADIQNNPNALVDAGGVTVFVAGGLMRFVTLILLLVVPLLTRSKMIDLVDRVLVIDAPEVVQLERLMGRDDIDEALVDSAFSEGPTGDTG